MKRRYCYFIMAILHVLSSISAATRPFALHEGQLVVSFQASLDSKQALLHKSMVKINENEKAKNRGLRTLGSRPPNCEHQCGSCKPCIAVQVPAANTGSHLRLHYANYEPEGWKCKCATTTTTSFSTP